MIYSAPYFGTKTDLNVGWDPGLWNRINRKIAYLLEYIIFLFVQNSYSYLKKKKKKNHTKSTEMLHKDFTSPFYFYHNIVTCSPIRYYDSPRENDSTLSEISNPFWKFCENCLYTKKNNVYNKLVPHLNAQKIIRKKYPKLLLGFFKKHNFTLDTISLRATRRSSVRLTPKIPNYVIHDLDYDIIWSKSSRGIILLLLPITK